MTQQILDNFFTIFGDRLSGIFHHNVPVVKMWYESIFYTSHQINLNNILINDLNIL